MSINTSKLLYPRFKQTYFENNSIEITVLEYLEGIVVNLPQNSFDGVEVESASTQVRKDGLLEYLMKQYVQKRLTSFNPES